MLWMVGFVMIAFGVAARVGARDSAHGYLVTVVCLLLAAGLWGFNGLGFLCDNEAMMAGLVAIGMSCITAGVVAGEVYLLHARRTEKE